MSRYTTDRGDPNVAVLLRDVGIAATVLVTATLFGCPVYNVWEQGLVGEAELKRAEQNRKIAVQEAEAKFDASSKLAAADVERAKGVAEANRIIGESLKNNEAYLRYLWIHNLETGKNQIIYVPTEAGMPILEASRLLLTPPSPDDVRK